MAMGRKRTGDSQRRNCPQQCRPINSVDFSLCYQRNDSPNLITRFPPFCNEGFAKPVPNEVNPASSMMESIVEKFGWLNTFSICMCQANVTLSFILKFLNKAKLPVLVQ